MKLFRKIIFWLHLLSGTIAGIIIFTMCVTGMLLAFEKQIVRFAERDFRFVNAGAVRIGISEVIDRVRNEKPDLKIDSISIKSDPSSSITLSIGRENVLYVDPYSGKILGEGSRSVRSFFRSVTNVHRWLGSNEKNRATGKSITGICNIAFLILAISGLYLWWPRNWTPQQVRAITWFQRNLKGRSRDFNWHNSIGFWCAPVLIILTLTGMIISYQWASNLLYTLTRTEKPPQSSPTNRSGGNSQAQLPSKIDQLLQRTQQQIPKWETITFRLPAKADAPISFSIEAAESINPFARSELTFDAKTGNIAKYQSYATANTGRKLRVWARGLHTGEALRIPGQILAFVATTGGAFLVFTGLSLAVRRLRNWLRKRAVVFSVKQMNETTESY
jgi:uncharacterized iron-regulated membrane protein